MWKYAEIYRLKVLHINEFFFTKFYGLWNLTKFIVFVTPILLYSKKYLWVKWLFFIKVYEDIVYMVQEIKIGCSNPDFSCITSKIN